MGLLCAADCGSGSHRFYPRIKALRYGYVSKAGIHPDTDQPGIYHALLRFVCSSSIYTGLVVKSRSNLSQRHSGPALRFVAAALIVRDGEVLIGQRRPDQPMASLWEFPGGKIEPGESPEQALVRELTEELGIQAEVGPPLTRIRHNYRHGGAVDLRFFTVRNFAGEIQNLIYQQVRWVKLGDLPSYEFLAADRGLIRDLAAGKLL